MGMNTSSRSTPTSPMHRFSFTSHVRWSCSVENFIWRSTRRVWFVKTFGFTWFSEGICSTHRGSWNHKPESLEIINSSSKAEHGWESRGYNLPKTLCIRGKAHKVIQYEGHGRIKSDKGSGGPQGIWCEHRHSTRGRKNVRRSYYRNNRLIQSSNAKELWFPNQGIRSNALIRDG